MPVWSYSRRESRERAHLDRQVLCLNSKISIAPATNSSRAGNDIRANIVTFQYNREVMAEVVSKVPVKTEEMAPRRAEPAAGIAASGAPPTGH